MNPTLEETLTEAGKKLESKRKKLNFWNKPYRFFIRPLSFLVGVGFSVGVVVGFFLPPILLWVLGLLIVFIGLNSINNPSELYDFHIREKLLPEIFKKINPDYHYEPYGFDADALKNSGIFNKSFFSNHTFITGEDLVKGKIDDVSVQFNEVRFYKKKVNIDRTIWGFILTIVLLPFVIIINIIALFTDGVSVEIPFFGIVRDEVGYYKGLFMQADFHKHFSGEVYMIPKKMTGLRDKISTAIIEPHLEKFNVENDQIQELYSLLCSNKQMAYYILSPKIIEAIQEIINVEKVTPVATFKRGKMYMTIPWEKDYFSVNLKEKVIGKEYFTKYINEIESFQKIIQHFNLDQRIWSKV